MRVSSIRRGLEFGKLATIRGQTKYHLSPFEQRAFAGAIATGVPNTLWRIRTNIFYWLPRKLIAITLHKTNTLSSKKLFYFSAITLAYLIYDAVEKEHDRLQRKQPGEFDHES